MAPLNIVLHEIKHLFSFSVSCDCQLVGLVCWLVYSGLSVNTVQGPSDLNILSNYSAKVCSMRSFEKNFV